MDQHNLHKKPSKFKAMTGPWYIVYPRLVLEWFFPGKDLSTEQIHIWAVIIGIIGGLATVVYQLLLKYIIIVIWQLIPNALQDAGAFSVYVMNKFITIHIGYPYGIIFG